jgi:hypothetical protein
MLWHAFLFLGLRFFLPFFLYLLCYLISNYPVCSEKRYCFPYPLATLILILVKHWGLTVS